MDITERPNTTKPIPDKTSTAQKLTPRMKALPRMRRHLPSFSGPELELSDKSALQGFRDLRRANAMRKLRESGDAKTTRDVPCLFRISERQVQRLEGLFETPEPLRLAIADPEGDVSRTDPLVLNKAMRARPYPFPLFVMIGLMGLVFMNACGDDGRNRNIKDFQGCGSQYCDSFPSDDNNSSDQLNDETAPGVDTVQVVDSIDSGGDPGGQDCSEGERCVNIDGQTPCLPIATADALEYLWNNGQGREFKVDGDVHQYFIFIYTKNHFNENEKRCQGDNIDFIVYLTSPAVVDILCIDNLSLSLSLCRSDVSACGDSLAYFVQKGRIFFFESLYFVEFTYRCSNPDYCSPEGSYRLFQEVKE